MNKDRVRWFRLAADSRAWLAALVLSLWVLGPGCAGKGGADEAEGGSGRDYAEVIERAREKNRETLKAERLKERIEQFQLRYGRGPSNLVELVTRGFIDSVPDAGEGAIFVYNPTNGVVAAARVPDSLARTALDETREPTSAAGD